jgi:hypothetical protein
MFQVICNSTMPLKSTPGRSLLLSEAGSAWVLPFYLVLFMAIWICSLNMPFFWDNILMSSQLADYYYNSHFATFLLPDSLDTGHPPFWGMYVALGWLLLGKKIWVGHLLMLPFVLGVVWQSYRLVKQFAASSYQFAVLGLVLADPTWIAQSVQVSSDVAILFFILLGLVSVIKHQPKLMALSATLLVLFSLRGLVYSFQIGLFAILWPYFEAKKFRPLQFFITFLPVVLLAASIYGYHWYAKGWFRYHPDSNWLTEAEISGLGLFFKNIAISGWRIVDFGRIGIWLCILPIFWQTWKTKVFDPKLLVLFSQVPIIFIVALSPEYMGHRYLMGLYLSGALLVGIWISTWQQSRICKFASMSLLLIFLLSGHFLPYPKQVAVGWDSTIAHVPYHALKADMVSFMDQNQISISETGSDFPNDAALGYADLSGRMEVFPAKNLQTQPFILYSNVFNGFSNEEIRTLEQNWTVLKMEKSGRVHMVLYAKP